MMLVAPLPAGGGGALAGVPAGGVAAFMSSVGDGAGAVAVSVVLGAVVAAGGVVVAEVPGAAVVSVVLGVAVPAGGAVVGVVPGAVPGVPGSYVAGGGEFGSAPLGIVCAPPISGVGLGSALAAEAPSARTPPRTIDENTFMVPSLPYRSTVLDMAITAPATRTRSRQKIGANLDHNGVFRPVELRFLRARGAAPDRMAPSPWPAVRAILRAVSPWSSV